MLIGLSYKGELVYAYLLDNRSGKGLLELPHLATFFQLLRYTYKPATTMMIINLKNTKLNPSLVTGFADVESSFFIRIYKKKSTKMG